MADEIIIRTPDQLHNVLEERRRNAGNRTMNTDAMNRKEEAVDAQHLEIATQLIKVINEPSIKIDPFIRKVMTLRIMAPILTGRERTHLSIALELGAIENDVIQAEQAGVEILNGILQRVCAPEFIEKFNRNRAADNAVRAEINKQPGKSASA